MGVVVVSSGRCRGRRTGVDAADIAFDGIPATRVGVGLLIVHCITVVLFFISIVLFFVAVILLIIAIVLLIIAVVLLIIAVVL